MRSLVISSKQEPDPFRKKIEQTFSSVFLPGKVERTTSRLGGVPCDILTPEVSATNRTIIYIHGGSFVGGSRDSWRSFCEHNLVCLGEDGGNDPCQLNRRYFLKTMLHVQS